MAGLCHCILCKDTDQFSAAFTAFENERRKAVLARENELLFNGKLRWISEKDNGLYDAMNKGFHMATGDVVGIINSDDLLAEPTAIEKVMKTFEEHPEADAVYADLYYVAQNDTSKIVRHWISGKQRRFKYGWHPGDD